MMDPGEANKPKWGQRVLVVLGVGLVSFAVCLPLVSTSPIEARRQTPPVAPPETAAYRPEIREVSLNITVPKAAAVPIADEVIVVEPTAVELTESEWTTAEPVADEPPAVEVGMAESTEAEPVAEEVAEQPAAKPAPAAELPPVGPPVHSHCCAPARAARPATCCARRVTCRPFLRRFRCRPTRCRIVRCRRW